MHLTYKRYCSAGSFGPTPLPFDGERFYDVAALKTTVSSFIAAYKEESAGSFDPDAGFVVLAKLIRISHAAQQRVIHWGEHAG